jgi:hypothetical protein
MRHGTVGKELCVHITHIHLDFEKQPMDTVDLNFMGEVTGA